MTMPSGSTSYPDEVVARADHSRARALHAAADRCSALLGRVWRLRPPEASIAGGGDAHTRPRQRPLDYRVLGDLRRAGRAAQLSDDVPLVHTRSLAVRSCSGVLGIFTAHLGSPTVAQCVLPQLRVHWLDPVRTPFGRVVHRTEVVHDARDPTVRAVRLILSQYRFARCRLLDGLGFRYLALVEDLERVTGRPVDHHRAGGRGRLVRMRSSREHRWCSMRHRDPRALAEALGAGENLSGSTALRSSGTQTMRSSAQGSSVSSRSSARRSIGRRTENPSCLANRLLVSAVVKVCHHQSLQLGTGNHVHISGSNRS